MTAKSKAEMTGQIGEERAFQGEGTAPEKGLRLCRTQGVKKPLRHNK